MAKDDLTAIMGLDINETGYTGYDSDNIAGIDSSATIEAKIGAGAEPANLTCEAGVSVTLLGAVFEFSGVHADVWDTAGVECTDAGDSQTFPTVDCSITTTTDNALVCYIVHKDGNGATFGTAAGWTSRIASTDAAWTANEKLAMACIVKATAGVQTLSSGALDSGVATTDWGAMLVALKADAGVSFTTGPTVAAATDGYTISGTLSGAGTLTAYAVACFPGDADATNAQVEAGQCEGGDTAEISANEVWTTDVANNFPLTDAMGVLPNYKVCVSGSDGTNDTAVTCSTTNRTANTGYALHTLTTLSGTSWFAQPTDNTGDTTLGSNVITGLTDASDIAQHSRISVSSGFADTVLRVESKTATSLTVDQVATSTVMNVTVNGVIDGSGNWLFPTALATGDVLELQTTADIGGTVTGAADFDATYAPDAGEENDLATILAEFQDISDTTDGLFASPTNPVSVYINNVAPTCDISDIAGAAFYGAVSIDLSTRCTHPSITVTFETRAGDTYHTGLSLTASTISGTVATENESGVTTQIWACADDLCQLLTWLSYYVNTFTVPNVVGSTFAAAQSTINTSGPWREDGQPLSTTTTCAISSGLVESQSPTATSEAAPYATITLTMDNGGICTLRRRN